MGWRRTIALVLALFVVAGTATYLLRDAAEDAPPVDAESPGTSKTSVAVANAPPIRVAKPDDGPRANVSSSPDPFELIRSLARIAYDGDGRAQYVISRELDRCEVNLQMVRKQPGDPEAFIWSLPDSSWPQPMKESAIAEVRRCIRLLKEDPFAGLPPRQGGYSFKYWMQRSVEAGSFKQRANPDSVNKLATAMMTGDPEIALTIGFRRLAMIEDRAQKTSAVAWMLAACRLGADCSSTSRSIPFWMCYDPNYPNCNVDGSVELMTSNALSPAGYGEAYSQSQLIEEALRSRDPDAIRKLLEKLL